MHIVADPRLVRRVIKRHRGITGLGLEVPHGHCCLIDREALLHLVTESELGTTRDKLEPRVILIARPEREVGATDSMLKTELWRQAFHGHVHHHLDGRVASGDLTEAIIRQRIDRIGQTEFDEIRTVLHGEELLFSVKDDREAYVEFAAFYLELRHFAPDAVAKFFPTIRDAAIVEDALAADVEVDALLVRCRPDGAAALVDVHAPPRSATLAPSASPPPSSEEAKALLEEAAGLRAKGNSARAAVLSGRAALAGIPGAEATAASDLGELVERLGIALHTDADAAETAPTAQEWSEALLPLAQVASLDPSTRALEARVLHDLQKVCVDAERERRTVDVITWVTTLGRRPVVRPLQTMRLVRIARHLRHAFAVSHRAHLAAPDRARLEAVFHQAGARADGNVRRVVKPTLEQSLDEVGLRPRSVPETVAREKLCEEVLDQILERGFLGIGQLRDALSRSNLKLPDLTTSALLTGDPLLRADARLAERLDGVYRRGEIYLRGLQKVSSLAFGTGGGRVLTLHLALPLLAAFVILEASSHLVHPIAHALGHTREIHVLTPISLGGLALVVYAMIHGPTVRRAAMALLRGIGHAIRAVFFRLPRWVLTRPIIRAISRSAPVTLALRLVVKPLALGAPAFFLARHFQLSQERALLASALLFAITALFLGTPLGFRMEEALTEVVVRRLRAVSRRVLPGLFALIVDFFRVVIEALDRAIYTVDEKLTFKTGESTLSLVAKGVLGTAWFFVTYILRIYVNLLIEPQVNPIKHFPVVTVSHKIILPMGPTILGALRQPLLPIVGPVVANTIAGSTVFLLPGVFGFLVWELKNNWGLYHANRAATLQPVRIGHHGETMNGLLVPGFHQGTIPKVFAKLRHAARTARTSVNRHRESIHQVEHGLHRFAERELAGLLHATTRWDAGAVAIETVEVSSNRIRMGVTCRGSTANVAWIHFEEQSGLLVANMAQPGFVDTLSDDDRHTFETALGGLYKLAGVDIVREQVEALLGPDMPYDIADEGLLVWPGHAYGSEIVYDLTQSGTLTGRLRGEARKEAPRTLSAEDLVFRRQPIAWNDWVGAWKEGRERGKIVSGPPILRARVVAS